MTASLLTRQEAVSYVVTRAAFLLFGTANLWAIGVSGGSGDQEQSDAAARVAVL